MYTTTAGRAALAAALPADLRHHALEPLDKRGIAALFDALARAHPGEYAETARRLSDLARDAAYATGGFSFGLGDMAEPPEAAALKRRVEGEVRAIHARADLDDAAKDRAVVAALQRHQKPLEDAVFAASLAERNPLAMQVQNVGRGNRGTLKSLRAGDLLYEDHQGRPVPVAVTSSYAKGLRPHEYWAASFGARKGIYDVKKSTADAGYFAKQLVGATHRLVVTAVDADRPPPPGETRGLPVAVDDPDNEGALLAAPAGPYPRDHVLTPEVLAHLKAQGVGRILVRSPIVGGPPEGGVYARDMGVRERGGLPPVGDYVGIAASQALSEKLTQSGLSSKHSGGVAGAGPTGFHLLNQYVQVPKVFPGGAAHARVDGRVERIEEAPQGGTYLTVAGDRHYAEPGRTPVVAVGQAVEAGDPLTDGLPHPAELVRHKGIGEGRRRFMEAFLAAYRAAGMAAHRRNVEPLARGLIDHVEVTDEFGPHVPGDVLPYQALEAAWEPRAGARELAPAAAVGRYLERPALHYTLGTPIRPSVAAELERFGVGSVLAHDEPPPFRPTMIRGMDLLAHDPDPLVRHLGSNLRKSTLEAVHRGRATDPLGTSYVPAVALSREQFGRAGATRGRPDPRDGDGDGRVGDGTPGEHAAG